MLDGVSEGQFYQVLLYELDAIRKIGRMGRGNSYTPSKLPPKPLEIWSYEDCTRSAGRIRVTAHSVQVPTEEVLSFGDNNFIRFEEAGIKEAQDAAFVLVAGGLGERLGYNGIKVALPAETTTGTCYLQLYIESILALQEASSRFLQGALGAFVLSLWRGE
ncbi:hypothetical protein J1N35_041087, partial [Gossypium stocksii]